MFDTRLRPIIQPVIASLARVVIRMKLSANQLTLLGLFIGAMAVLAISCQWYLSGLFLVLCSRLMDGLDGTVARLEGPTKFGGYLDIVCDLAFYGGIIVGFGLSNPVANAIPALVLVHSFILTGGSFLAYAATIKSDSDSSEKAFVYDEDLMAASETIGFFVMMCVFPNVFPTLAWIMAILCWYTVIRRSLRAKNS